MHNGSAFPFEHSRWFWAATLLLFAMLIGIGTWQLPESPATWFDEGINLGIAKSLADDGVYSLLVGPNEFVKERQFLITTNYPVLLPVAGSVALFGNTLLAARLPMVFFLALFAALAFAFSWKLFGRLPALFTLALIVSFVPFYGNGKPVLGEVPGLLYFLAGLFVLHGAISRKRLFFAGLLFGLSAATKPFFLLVLPAVAVGEAYRYWKKRDALLKRMLFIAAGAVAPLLGWLYTVLPSVSIEGVRSMVFYYANSYASTGFFTQVFHNFLRFFTETTPLHFMLLFVVSLFAAVKRFRKSMLTEGEVILWAFIGATALWYLKTPGWYRYFFSAHLLLFFLFPAALFLFSRRVAVVACALLFIFQSGFLTLKRNDPLYRSGEAQAAADFVETYTSADASMLLVNAPSVSFLLSRVNTSQFLQINRALFFGKESLQNTVDMPYRFLVVNGSLSDTALRIYEEEVSRTYRTIGSFGYYTIYQRL